MSRVSELVLPREMLKWVEKMRCDKDRSLSTTDGNLDYEWTDVEGITNTKVLFSRDL